MTIAGALRHRVTLQSATETATKHGARLETWAAVATVWAEVSPLQGREFMEGRREESELDSRIRIRYRAGVVPGMRIVWGSRIYDIMAVIETGAQRRELVLMCREQGLDR